MKYGYCARSVRGPTYQGIGGNFITLGRFMAKDKRIILAALKAKLLHSCSAFI